MLIGRANNLFVFVQTYWYLTIWFFMLTTIGRNIEYMLYKFLIHLINPSNELSQVQNLSEVLIRPPSNMMSKAQNLENYFTG